MNDPRDAWAAEFEGLGEDYMRGCLHAGLSKSFDMCNSLSLPPLPH
jgi:hypothetical protein